MSRIAIIINEASGNADKVRVIQHLQQRARMAGMPYDIFSARRGRHVDACVRQAMAGAYDRFIVCGGDGTVTSVAQHLAGTSRALGVVPLGTFNYFARNLGLPEDPLLAIDGLFPGRTASVPVGQVNDRVFLNNASLGFYPELLLAREQMQKKLGRHKWSALVSGLLAALRRPSPIDLHLAKQQQTVARRTPLLYACCNVFQLAHFDAPGCACVQDARLVVFVTAPVGRVGLAGLALRTFLGRLKEADNVEILCLKEAWVQVRRRRLHVAIDGEVVTLQAPLHVRMQDDALRVILPQE